MKTSFKSKELFEKIKTDETKYDVIILIIASRGETYDLFVDCWRAYMNLYPTVKAYFLYSDPSIQSDIMIYEDSIIYKDTETAIPGIFKKTTAAMSFCQKYFNYDYILRTNLSSFLHIPRLLQYLSTQNKECFVAAHYNKIPVDLNNKSKIAQVEKQTKVNTYFKKILNDKFIFLHGALFILSNDITQKLLAEIKNNYEELTIPLELPDDIGISMILYNFLSFDEDIDSADIYHPREFINLYDYKYCCPALENPNTYENDNIFHIRNKVNEPGIDNSIEGRHTDIMNYIFQVRHFYNMPDFMIYIDEVPEKKIVDCFIFNNELDMLEYRLSVLDDTVDYFILVEATKTFVGTEKTLYYSENKERFSKFNNKIIHIIVDDLIIPNIDKGEQWDNERKQRDNIKTGIDMLTLSENDYILISDVDEIPDPDFLSKLKSSNNNVNYANLKQDFYYYNLNTKYNELWLFPKILTHREYLSRMNITNDEDKIKSSISEIRLKIADQTIEMGGWHLSYFGSISSIKDKLLHFSHQEFNNEEIINDINIQKKIDNFEDILDRPVNLITKLLINDNTHLPPNYEMLLKLFSLKTPE